MKKIYYNGKFYTKNGFKSCVWVENGVIKAMHETDVLDEKSEKIDLNGHLVLPGFNDAHLHLFHVGAQLEKLRLQDVHSLQELIEKAKAFIQSRPIQLALYGEGWNQDKWDQPIIPTKHDLDQISTEIPVILRRVCGHIAVCNTIALKELNVTETSHVSGGTFEKDKNGQLTGVLTENALRYLGQFEKLSNVDDILVTLQKGIAHASSKGITSIQPNDINSQDGNHLKIWRSYKTLDDQEKLNIRVSLQATLPTVSDFATFFHGYKPSKYLSVNAYKVFADGSLGARTAALNHDYVDEIGNKGILILNKADLSKILKQANKLKKTVLVHVIGDAAIQAFIDAFEKTCPSSNPLRHGIVHCQITNEQLLKRIAKNQLYVYAQPIFLDVDMHIVEQRVGKKLADTSYAFKTLYQTTPTSFSSDAPVEDLNPLHGIYCAVTRKNLANTKTYRAEEQMSLEEAIDAYTHKGAWMSFEEKTKGLIEVGFLADFVVLEKNLFEIPIEEIPHVQVVHTIVGGEIVYNKE